MEVSFVFLIAGVIILIGFFGGLSFERTKVPDVLALLGIGVFLGPLFRLVDPDSLTHFAEYFGSLALMIILFEGGMGVRMTVLIFPSKKDDSLIMLSMLPRGLASAVLATLPKAANMEGSENFIDYTFAVIVLTNILMTIGVFYRG